MTLLLLSANIFKADEIKITANITFKQEELDKLETNRNACKTLVDELMTVVNGSKELVMSITDYSINFDQRKETYNEIQKKMEAHVSATSNCEKNLLEEIKENNKTFLKNVEKYFIPTNEQLNNEVFKNKFLNKKDINMTSNILSYSKYNINHVMLAYSQIEFEFFALKIEKITTVDAPPALVFNSDKVKDKMIIMAPAQLLGEETNSKLDFCLQLNGRGVVACDGKGIINHDDKAYNFNWKSELSMTFTFQHDEDDYWNNVSGYKTIWDADDSSTIIPTLFFDYENKIHYLYLDLAANRARKELI